MVASWKNLEETFVNATVNGVTRFTAEKLLQAILDAQQEELALLKDLNFKVDLLLKADSKAAREHLRFAELRMKAQGYDPKSMIDELPEDARQDIQQAKALLIRAIGQHAEPLEVAYIHRDIAICAKLLKDDFLASLELSRAKESAQKWMTDLAIRRTEHESKKAMLCNHGPKGTTAVATVAACLINPLIGLVAWGGSWVVLYKLSEQAKTEEMVLNKYKAKTSDFISLLENMGKGTTTGAANPQ